MMNRTLFKALGALLTYPTPELIAALPEIEAIVRGDKHLRRAARAGLVALIAELGRSDLIDLQERYVELFDRGRKTALHLFEHVHGDSRERGPAMVELKRIYAEAGYVLATHELPDYLPAVLEFVALAPERADDILADCAHVVRTIGEALLGRGSRYAAVPAAILAAIGEPGLAPAAAPAVAEPSLDEEWREEEVLFGPPSGTGCGNAQPAASVVRFMPRRA